MSSCDFADLGAERRRADAATAEAAGLRAALLPFARLASQDVECDDDCPCGSHGEANRPFTLAEHPDDFVALVEVCALDARRARDARDARGPGAALLARLTTAERTIARVRSALAFAAKLTTIDGATPENRARAGVIAEMLRVVNGVEPVKGGEAVA